MNNFQFEAIFIADIHLTENKPEITQAFVRFMREKAIKSVSLYILGDLFEFWVGDDILSEFHQNIINEFNLLQKNGTKCFFIAGNRDFLFGKSTKHFSGLQILPDKFLLKILNLRILILHGDLLCTDDLNYQKYRKWVNNKWIQTLFLFLPKKIRLNIAERMRDKSEKANQQKNQKMMNVNQNEIVQLFEKYNAQIMIHGHTHKPEKNEIFIENARKTRYVLGAWDENAEYITIDKQGNINFCAYLPLE